MIQIRKDLLEGIPQNKSELYNGKRIIVIHNTATPGANADATNHYFHNNWNRVQAFVHAAVDWRGMVFENAEAGNQVWGAGHVNRYAWLQVEQCITSSDNDNAKSAEYVAEYVAKKIKESGHAFDDFMIIDHAYASHHFGGTDHEDSIVAMPWDTFIGRIRALSTGAKVSEHPTTVRKELPTQGTFRCGYAIKARGLGPDTANAQVWLFKAGDKIKYDRVLTSNGYEWISQRRSTGGYWYIPVRDIKTNDYWGKAE